MTMSDTCVYNNYVTCSPKDCNQCETCGWNPKVDAKRKQEEKKHGK